MSEEAEVYVVLCKEEAQFEYGDAWVDSVWLSENAANQRKDDLNGMWNKPKGFYDEPSWTYKTALVETHKISKEIPLPF